MARREVSISIDREGRDKGKVFTLREMPAAQAEDWFLRAMMLLARSGADVPPDIFQQGAMGFAAMGLGAVLTGVGKTPFFEVKPLLDEMLTCIASFQAPGAAAPVGALAQIMTQIEEVATLMQLREEVLSLHLGFSLSAKLSEFRTLAATMMAENGPITEMSPAASPSSSPDA